MQIKELYKKFLKAKGADIKYKNLAAGKKIDVSKKGLWDKKKKQVIVPSNRITMKGPNGEQDFFKKPVVATGLQSGQQVMMQPGGEYYFPNDKAVHEVRMQKGGKKEEESSLENLAELFDPTGVLSWGDANRAYNAWQKSNSTLPSMDQALDMFGAVPGLGKLGKLKYLDSDAMKVAYKSIPWQQILNVVDYTSDEASKVKTPVKKEYGGWSNEYQDGGNVLPMGDYDLNSAPKQGKYLLPDINRPSYVDESGNKRSEYKIGINVNGKEVLIPTVVNGKQLSEDEAIARYYKTGLHMGEYNTPEESDYAARTRTAKYNMLQDPIRFQANQFSVGGMAEINPNTLGFQEGGSVQTDITTPIKPKSSPTQDAFNAMLDQYETSKSNPEEDASSPEDMGFKSGGELPVVINALFSNYQNGIGKKYAQQGMIRIGDNPSTSDNTFVKPQFVDKAAIAKNQQQIAYAQTPQGKAELAATKKRVEADLLKKEQARIQREREAKQRKLAEMQARIADSKKVQDLPLTEQFTPENIVRATQATGDKFRAFGPESPLVTSGLFEADPNSIFDEYINPAKMIGDMATDLAVGTSEAIKTKSLKPLVAPVVTPLVAGALGAVGSTGKKAKALDNAVAPTQFNRMVPASSSVYSPSLMPNLQTITSRTANANADNVVRELSPEQLRSIMQRATQKETINRIENNASRDAMSELYDYSQIPTYDVKDLQTAINKNLEQGYGIVSPDFKGTPLSVRVHKHPADPHMIGVAPYYGDQRLGLVELKQNLRPYWKGDKSTFNEWNNTPGFRKTNDFPYGIVPPETIGPKGVPTNEGLSFGDRKLYQQDFYGSGISGELNKAINEALKERNLGHIISGGTGHTLEGKARWDNLVQKGKAVKLGDDNYKLLKKGGNVDHSNDDDMVNGVASILRRVKDKNNRKDLANQLSKQFDREKVKYNLSDFLNKSKVKK